MAGIVKIDLTSPAAKWLQADVFTKIKELWKNQDLEDDAVAQYTVALVARGSDKARILTNLKGVLGADDAEKLMEWLIPHLRINKAKYEASAAQVKAASAAPAAKPTAKAVDRPSIKAGNKPPATVAAPVPAPEPAAAKASQVDINTLLQSGSAASSDISSLHGSPKSARIGDGQAESSRQQQAVAPSQAALHLDQQKSTEAPSCRRRDTGAEQLVHQDQRQRREQRDDTPGPASGPIEALGAVPNDRKPARVKAAILWEPSQQSLQKDYSAARLDGPVGLNSRLGERSGREWDRDCHRVGDRPTEHVSQRGNAQRGSAQHRSRSRSRDRRWGSGERGSREWQRRSSSSRSPVRRRSGGIEPQDRPREPLRHARDHDNSERLARSSAAEQQDQHRRHSPQRRTSPPARSAASTGGASGVSRPAAVALFKSALRGTGVAAAGTGTQTQPEERAAAYNDVCADDGKAPPVALRTSAATRGTVFDRLAPEGQAGQGGRGHSGGKPSVFDRLQLAEPADAHGGSRKRAIDHIDQPSAAAAETRSPSKMARQQGQGLGGLPSGGSARSGPSSATPNLRDPAPVKWPFVSAAVVPGSDPAAAAPIAASTTARVRPSGAPTPALNGAAAPVPASRPASSLVSAAGAKVPVSSQPSEYERLKLELHKMEMELSRMKGGIAPKAAAAMAPGVVGTPRPSGTAPAPGTGLLPAFKDLATAPPLGVGRPMPTPAQRAEADARSVVVQGMDFRVTEEVLSAHFSVCGPVSRVTVLRDPYTGASRCVAYVEYASSNAAHSAVLTLNGSDLLGRLIKVSPKRTGRQAMHSASTPLISSAGSISMPSILGPGNGSPSQHNNSGMVWNRDGPAAMGGGLILL